MSCSWQSGTERHKRIQQETSVHHAKALRENLFLSGFKLTGRSQKYAQLACSEHNYLAHSQQSSRQSFINNMKASVTFKYIDFIGINEGSASTSWLMHINQSI